MAIPGSGEIAVTDLSTEFGGTAPHGMSEYYRGGGLVPDSAGNSAVPTSGAIALGNFYGSANIVALSLTITSNTNNYDLYSVVSSNPAYSAGSTAVTLTVNPGVTVGSTSTGTYAFSVPNAFAAGDTISIVNNGTIVGRGGNGGQGTTSFNGAPGGTGGNAVYVNRPVSITNAGTLAGAGGGGAASAATNGATGFWPKSGGPQGQLIISGNGGGGGAGVNAGSGGPGSHNSPTNQPASNPGSGGTATAGGAGGARQNGPGGYYSGAGGSGGARGANGSPPEYGSHNSAVHAGTGGTRGNYLTGNPYVTWVANGTRLGGVS